jgi:hypothetical protein
MERPYISGPMTGCKHLNFPLFFRVESFLTSMGMRPLNPARATGTTWEDAFRRAVEHPNTWEWYLKRDLHDVIDSDAIILLPKWRMSKGACIEAMLSVCIGHGVYELAIDENGDLHIEEAHRSLVYGTAMQYLMDCGLAGVDLSGYAQHGAT